MSFPFFLSRFTSHDYTSPDSLRWTIQFGKHPVHDVECSRESNPIKKEYLMRKSKVGVGVIGVGGISGSVHLPGLRLSPQAEIVALCDTNADLLRRRSGEYGVEHIFTEYSELLQYPAVDAVVIATPTVYHAPIALAAIAAGKHVLVEKQLGMNYAETVQMY